MAGRTGRLQRPRPSRAVSARWPSRGRRRWRRPAAATAGPRDTDADLDAGRPERRPRSPPQFAGRQHEGHQPRRPHHDQHQEQLLASTRMGDDRRPVPARPPLPRRRPPKTSTAAASFRLINCHVVLLGQWHREGSSAVRLPPGDDLVPVPWPEKIARTSTRRYRDGSPTWLKRGLETRRSQCGRGADRHSVARCKPG